MTTAANTTAPVSTLPAMGSKYVSGVSATEISKLIRTDIKAAVKAGALPADLKVSVVTRGSSMHSAIDITIKAFTGPVLNVERVRFSIEKPHSPCFLERFSPELTAAMATLKSIMDAYNYDKSDLMTDYHNVNFYGNVTLDWQFERDIRKAVVAQLAAEGCVAA